MTTEQAAFIRDTQSLALWTDNVKDLLPEIVFMQAAMIDFLWNTGRQSSKPVAKTVAKAASVAAVDAAEDSESVEHHVEMASGGRSVRPAWQQAPMMGGLTTGLNVLLACTTIRASLLTSDDRAATLLTSLLH